MAVKIRLKRMGAKKKPFYRVVVADSRAPRDGRFIEEIGYYDPMKDPGEISIDAEKAKKWLGNGAQPTDTVKSLLKKTRNRRIRVVVSSVVQLVEAIAKSLVDNPDAVFVTETEEKQGITIQLKVAPEDMGKVIGKQGRIARALRTVVRAAATKENKKVIVEIVQ